MPDTNAPNITVVLNVDEKAFQDQMVRASATMAKAFRASLRGIESSFDKTAKDIATRFEAVFLGTAGDAGRSGAQAGRNYSAQFVNNTDLTQGIQTQIDALQRSVRSRGDLAESFGLDRDLFAGAEAQIEEVVRQLRAFEVAQRQGLNPEQVLAWGKTLDAALGGARGELRATEGVLRGFSDEVNRQRTANTAVFQQETTLQNAQIRSQAQLQIQESQRAGRARIEIARFTFRQIQFFEQQISRAVRASFSGIGNLATSAAAGVARLGRVFRRSNSDLNDGLRGALRQRESSLDRSFRRQTSTVNSNIARQSASLQRFERQASTGLAGLATGRSQLGALLGGGAALGGGFALFRGLKAGFDEAVNLNEAMNAVVQIFGTATDEVVKFTENSVEALFLTQSEALKAAQNFGVFGKSAGLVGSELAGFSNELTLIAADLASFYNTTVPEAVTSVSAALRGESEPIRRYGVLLNEQILRQRALQEGIIDSDRQLVPSERVLAAYAEIMKQTAVAQGDAARTADDFANASRRARAASVTTFSSIAKVAIPVAEVLLKGVIPSLEELNNFITGNVGPALQTLRVGLVGAAAALGSLLAVRGAIEVIQFLGVALRAVVTPIGFVVTATAALGAAIAILRDRSPEATRVFDRIREVLTSGFLSGLERAAELFRTIATFLTTRVFPVLVGLAVLLARQVGPAFQFIADIVENRVLPVFRTIGGVLVAGLSVVLPVLEAVIGQLIRLGQAVGSAFTGDFGGLASIGQDILNAFRGLGDLIVEALVPQLQRAVGFITSFFGGIDWQGIGLSALEVINTIGRVLGSIASDPRFITALAAVAAAGAAVVGAFVLGVADGLNSNRDGLIRLLNDGISLVLTESLKLAISNPELVAILVGGAFLVRGVVTAFSDIGAQGGGSFARGLSAGFTRAAGSVRALFGGLFGPSAEQQFAQAGQRNALAYQREFQRISNRVRRISGADVQRLDQSTPFNERDVRRAKQQLREVTAVTGEARAGVLAFRGAIRDAFKATNGADARRALGDAFRGVNFRQLGQSAGVGVLFGFTAAVSGSQGGKGGLAGVVISAISAGVSSGNAYVGAAVGAVGLIAAAWGTVTAASKEAKRVAEEYAAEVTRIGEALIGLSGAEQANLLADELASSLREAGLDTAGFTAGFDIAGQVAAGIETGQPDIQAAWDTALVNLDISPAARDSIQQNLSAAGINLDQLDTQFQDIGDRLRTTQSEWDSSFLQVTPEENAAYDSLVLLYAALERSGSDLGELSDFVSVLFGDIGTFADALSASNLQETWRLQVEAIKPNVVAVEELTQAQKDLNAAQDQQTTQGFFDRLFPQLQALGLSVPRIFNAIVEAAKDAGESINLSFLASLFGVSDGVSLIEVTALRANSALEILRGNIESFRGIVGEAEQGTTEWADALDEAQQAEAQLRQDTTLLQSAIESLNEQRTNALNVQIEGLTLRLDSAKEAADLARESLTAFITGDYQDTTAALIDDLIGNLEGVGESIAQARKKGGQIGAAEVRSIFGDLDADIAGIVQAGFEEGLTGAQIQALFGPLNSAIGEVTNPLTAFFDSGNVIVPQDVTDRIFDQIQRRVDPKQIDVNAGAIFGAEAEVERMQRQLDAARENLEIEVKFNDDQIAEELARAGLDRRQIELVLTTGNSGTLQGTSQEQAIAQFQEAFANVALLFLNANGQAPAGGEINNTFTIVAPGNDPEQIADSVIGGLADSQVQAAGGTTTTPRINVIYRPNAGSNVQ